MENIQISFYKTTERLPPKDTPLWLLIQMDGDTILYKGTYFGLEQECHLFKIDSGGYCCPLAWTEIQNVPSIPIL